MNPHVTNWTPGIVVAVVGFAVSLVVFFLSRSKSPKATAPAQDAKLADLNERVQLIVDQLRALEGERHMMGSAYEPEKARLEQEGAATLRARDEYLRTVPGAASSGAPAAAGAGAAPGAAAVAGGVPVAAAPAPTGFWSRHRELKGALWGAGVVGFFVLGGYLINASERDRGASGPMTGMVPPNDDGAMGNRGPMQGGGQQAAQNPTDEDPHFKAFLERAQKNPQDTEAAAYAAHVLIREQRFDEAEKLTNQALAADPFHVESRIHRCVLRATMGQLKESVDELGEISRLYPDSYEALLFRGAIAMQIGESRVALESFERFVTEAPKEEQPPQVQDAMAMLRQQLAHAGP